MPSTAAAALLPAVPNALFLAALERNQYNPFTFGLNGWTLQQRAKFRLHASLLWHTVKNDF